MKEVGQPSLEKLGIYHDHLPGFSESLFLKYKASADSMNGHCPLDLADAQNDMKADGNPLQDPEKAQFMLALPSSV